MMSSFPEISHSLLTHEEIATIRVPWHNLLLISLMLLVGLSLLLGINWKESPLFDILDIEDRTTFMVFAFFWVILSAMSILVLVRFGMLLVWFPYEVYATLYDKKKGIKKILKGKVEKKYDHVYKIRVCEKNFLIDRQTWENIEAGQQVKITTLPKAGSILRVEILSS